MNCGTHRRNIIQRKISKMPLAQIFFVGAGGIAFIISLKDYIRLLFSDMFRDRRSR